jgi:hypothetical protein
VYDVYSDEKDDPRLASLQSRYIATIIRTPASDFRLRSISHYYTSLSVCFFRRQHVPPYGSRATFVPRSQDDFADGGAYPEIHVPQFPLEMGRPGRVSQNLRDITLGVLLA